MVFSSALALFDQVFGESVSFNYLFTFPACRQHWALLPVMNVNRFCIKVFIESATEVADLFVFIELFKLVFLLLELLLLVLLIILFLLLILFFWLWLSGLLRFCL